ncbi:MAG: arginine repressor [Lachnospiraceae bacterium]|nr:arginine repressor [Lachnospiraceae bacterium]
MKSSRQNKIIEIVKKYDVETQEELAEYLTQAGFAVTQATVSRDIRELKLTKVQGETGRQKYAVLQSGNSHAAGMNERLVRVLKDAFVSMDKAQNILVIKTVSGMAMAAAAALDSLEIDNLIGCIAGDDTIMCAIRTEADTEIVMEEISGLVYGK